MRVRELVQETASVGLEPAFDGSAALDPEDFDPGGRELLAAPGYTHQLPHVCTSIDAAYGNAVTSHKPILQGDYQIGNREAISAYGSTILIATQYHNIQRVVTHKVFGEEVANLRHVPAIPDVLEKVTDGKLDSLTRPCTRPHPAYPSTGVRRGGALRLTQRWRLSAR
jgi:hypothetical protein